MTTFLRRQACCKPFFDAYDSMKGQFGGGDKQGEAVFSPIANADTK